MGLGLILGALSSGANGAASTMAKQQEVADMERLEKARSELQTQAQLRVAEFKNKLDNAPAMRAGEFAKKASGIEVPVTADPVKELTSRDPGTGYVDPNGAAPDAIKGNYEELKARISQIPDPAERAEALGVLDAQLGGEQKRAQAAVAGQTRAPDADETLIAAREAAIRAGDTLAAESITKQLAGQQLHMGVGSTLLGANRKVIYHNADGQEIAMAKMAANATEKERDRIFKADIAEKKNGLLERIATQRAEAIGKSKENPDALLPDGTVKIMAEQYLAGDTSVLQNLGRGAQGSQNIIKVRNEIARQAESEGKGGADLAAKTAEYFGTKAGQRTAGTRIANVEMASSEAESLIPLARSASEAVARSGLLPFGKAQIMFDNQTNDPALRQFAAANNALVNVYSRAISPSGVPTVADKEHAREMISTAMDDKSYQAVLDQMQKEITAARAAPKTVRKAFNDEVTGRSHSTTAPNPVAPVSPKSGVVSWGDLK